MAWLDVPDLVCIFLDGSVRGELCRGCNVDCTHSVPCSLVIPVELRCLFMFIVIHSQVGKEEVPVVVVQESLQEWIEDSVFSIVEEAILSLIAASISGSLLSHSVDL